MFSGENLRKDFVAKLAKRVRMKVVSQHRQDVKLTKLKQTLFKSLNLCFF